MANAMQMASPEMAFAPGQWQQEDSHVHPIPVKEEKTPTPTPIKIEIFDEKWVEKKESVPVVTIDEDWDDEVPDDTEMALPWGFSI